MDKGTTIFKLSYPIDIAVTVKKLHYDRTPYRTILLP